MRTQFLLSNEKRSLQQGFCFLQLTLLAQGDAKIGEAERQFLLVGVGQFVQRQRPAKSIRSAGQVFFPMEQQSQRVEDRSCSAVLLAIVCGTNLEHSPKHDNGGVWLSLTVIQLRQPIERLQQVCRIRAQVQRLDINDTMEQGNGSSEIVPQHFDVRETAEINADFNAVASSLFLHALDEAV